MVFYYFFRFILESWKKKDVTNSLLDALREADKLGCMSVSIHFDNEYLRKGAATKLLKRVVTFKLDNALPLSHIRLSFKENETAGIVERAVKRNRKTWEKSNVHFI